MDKNAQKYACAPAVGAPQYIAAPVGYAPMQYAPETQQMPYPGQVQQDMAAQEAAIAKIENSVTSMEEQLLTNDRRHAQLLQLEHKIIGIPSPEATAKQEMPSKEATEAPFTPEQANQLRAQVGAYKKLQRQEPLAPSLASRAVTEVTTLLPDSYDYPAERENGEEMPNDLMVLSLCQQCANSSAAFPPLPGIDLQATLKEREYRIQNRIGTRTALLRNLPAHISVHPRPEAEVELRAARLLNLQTQIRNEVMNALRRDTTLEAAFNPRAYRRIERQSLREERVTERLGKQEKVEQERRRRQKNTDLLQTIVQHDKEFKEFIRNNQLKGLEWMVYNNNLNGILADEIGFGRTIETVALITYLIEVKKLNGPYLIIVPLSEQTGKKKIGSGYEAQRFNVLTIHDYVHEEKALLGKVNDFRNRCIVTGRPKCSMSPSSSTMQPVNYRHIQESDKNEKADGAKKMGKTARQESGRSKKSHPTN